MNALEIIEKKRDGLELSRDELSAFIEGYLSGKIPPYQLSAFLMAVFLRGMSLSETVALTDVMVSSGEVITFPSDSENLIDKHSTGGVGDKVSLVLLPIAVACGLKIPMISGRALGFTGGTLDKLESIPGFRTALSRDEIVEMVDVVGGCFAAQTEGLVPADRELYAMRDATATVESLPLIVSSILSKKIAEGVSGVVIDVKCGRGAFMSDLGRAKKLTRLLESVGSELSFSVKTVISSMDQPLGRAVGNALEVEEAIRMLMGGSGPDDLEELIHRLVGEMLILSGEEEELSKAIASSKSVLADGRAFEVFKRIVDAQGGKLDFESTGFGLPGSRVTRVVESEQKGYISAIDARVIGETLREIGGGRYRKEDTIDHSCGFVFYSKVGEYVEAGEPLFEVHTRDEGSICMAIERIKSAIRLSPEPPGDIAPLILSD